MVYYGPRPRKTKFLRLHVIKGRRKFEVVKRAIWGVLLRGRGQYTKINFTPFWAFLWIIREIQQWQKLHTFKKSWKLQFESWNCPWQIFTWDMKSYCLPDYYLGQIEPYEVSMKPHGRNTIHRVRHYNINQDKALRC